MADDGACGRMLRALALASGAAGILFLAIATPSLPQQLTYAAPWWNTLAVACVLVPPLLMAVGAFRFPLRWLRTACGVWVVGYLPVLALTPLAFAKDVIPLGGGWPWPPAISAAVICAAPLVLPARVFALYMVACSAALAAATWWTIPEPGWFRVAQSTVGAPLLGLLFAGVSLMALRSGATLDRDTEVMRAHAASRVAAAAKATERSRVDALIHDTVLAALLAAGRGADAATARRSAEQGLRTLDGLFDPDPGQEVVAAAEVVARLRQVCVELDENLVFTVAGLDQGAAVTAPVAQILQEVLGEAARNSVRHAAPGGRPVRRAVTVRLTGTTVFVEVADDGVGFDSRRVPPRRLGIVVGMRARIAPLPGARMAVRTAPGAGTTVAFAVPTDADAARPADATRGADEDVLAATTAPDAVRMHSAAAATLGGLFLASEAARAWENPGGGLVGPLYFTGAALLVGGLALLLAPGPDPMAPRRAAVLAAVPPLAALCNVLQAGGGQQHTGQAVWAWSAASLLMAFLTVRGRFALAWAGALGALGVYAVWTAPSAGGALAGQALWQLTLLAVCSLFGATMRRQVRRINATRGKALALAAERADTDTRLRERDRQLAYLNTTARPTLERIAALGVLPPREQREAALLEARLRDRIRARGLATEELLEAASRARRRGVEVILLDDGAADPAALAGVVDVAVRELDSSAAERVTIRVLPAGRAALCTIVHVGEDTYRRIEVGRGAELFTA